MGELSIDQRVLKLELIVDGHKEDLKELRDSAKMLSKSLEAIEKTLQQIKWLTIGGALVLVANEIGFIKVLKSLFF